MTWIEIIATILGKLGLAWWQSRNKKDTKDVPLSDKEELADFDRLP